MVKQIVLFVHTFWFAIGAVHVVGVLELDAKKCKALLTYLCMDISIYPCAYYHAIVRSQ